MTEQDALLVLNAVPGLGPSKARQLIECFGSAKSILGQDQEAVTAQGIVSAEVAINIVHFSKDKFLSDEYNLCQQKGVRIITMVDEIYPPQLRTIHTAPLVLYILGQAAVLSKPAVGMVGSRVCSYYGKQTAFGFAVTFANAGLVVVSGLARGIDTAAHQGCLKAKGMTVAVLGCGLSHVYPKENRALLEEITKTGAVISEMPMTTPPLPGNFPRRNRIISGLSTAVVVVEAGLKSGALITAHFALEQSREVFAIPANIDYTSAMGSNLLIKDGARVALSPVDVIEEMRAQLQLELAAETAGDAAPSVPVSIEEMVYYEKLSLEPMHIDVLTAQAGGVSGDSFEHLLNLELKGLIKKLPGSYYVRV